MHNSHSNASFRLASSQMAWTASFSTEILDCLEEDDENDDLLLEASQSYESLVTNSLPTASAFTSACASISPTHTPTVVRSSRFAALKSAAEIERARWKEYQTRPSKTQSTALNYGVSGGGIGRQRRETRYPKYRR